MLLCLMINQASADSSETIQQTTKATTDSKNHRILLIDPDSVYPAHEVTSNGFTRLPSEKLSKIVRLSMLSASLALGATRARLPG